MPRGDGRPSSRHRSRPLVALTALLLLAMGGCETLPTFTALKVFAAPEQPTDLLITAQPRSYKNGDTECVGLVVQAAMLSEQLAPLPANGAFHFFAYLDSTAVDSKIRPDLTWSFTAEQTEQAKINGPSGPTYAFWLPIGPRDSAGGKLLLVGRQDSPTIGRLAGRTTLVMTTPEAKFEMAQIKPARTVRMDEKGNVEPVDDPVAAAKAELSKRPQPLKTINTAAPPHGATVATGQQNPPTAVRAPVAERPSAPKTRAASLPSKITRK